MPWGKRKSLSPDDFFQKNKANILEFFEPELIEMSKEPSINTKKMVSRSSTCFIGMILS